VVKILEKWVHFFVFFLAGSPLFLLPKIAAKKIESWLKEGHNRVQALQLSPTRIFRSACV